MEVLREDLRHKEDELQRRAELGDLEPPTLIDAEDEVCNDGVPAITVLESETRDIIIEMLSYHENHVEGEQAAIKVEPFVEFDGNQIFKSTLVGQLNGNPFLSKDTLTRVKKSLYFNNSKDYLNVAKCSNTCFVGIGSDVGVFFVQRSTISRGSTVSIAKKRGRSRASKSENPASTLEGVDEGTWWIGCIQKMRRRAGGNSWGSLKQLVNLANHEVTLGKKGISVSNIQVILHYYTRAQGQYKFKYNLTDSQWIGLESVITNVILTYNSANQVYSMDRSDAENLNEYVSNNAIIE